MNRLLSSSSRRVFARSASRTIGDFSFRPPLHLLSPTATVTTPFYQPNSFFSTASSGPSSSSSSSSMPTNSAEMEQLALHYAREVNPIKAQQLLEQLPQDSPSVEILWPSVLDAWLNYQKNHLAQLKASLSIRQQQQQQQQQDSFTKSWREEVDEIWQAAESASQLVEYDWNDNTTTKKKKMTWDHVESVLQAWANTCEAIRVVGLHTPREKPQREWSGIPQRAQHILNQYQQVTTSGTKPNIECVNQVLKAWAFSGEHLQGTMAEQFFQNQKTPMNAETFRYLIRAWSWSKEKRAAFAANGYFFRMMRLLEGGQEDMRPTLEDYQVLFEAWSKTDDRNAPSKVHTLLQLIDGAYRKGVTTVRPDLYCYQLALQTMTRRNAPEIGDLVDQTLSEMKRERMLIPNTECYAASILAWKHVAMDKDSPEKEKAIQRSYDLLQEMVEAFHRTTIVTIRPKTEHYNHVLEALTLSKKTKATHRAETLLKVLEKSTDQVALVTAGQPEGDDSTSTLQASPLSQSSDGTMDLVANADSYKYTLLVWRNSKSPQKVHEAEKILNRFKERSEQIRSASTDQSMVEAMSAFISVCAKTVATNQEEAMDVMLKALRTLEAIRGMGLAPNSTTYAAILEACDHLVQDSHDRQRILENIFVRACEEGFVDRTVLATFKAAASSYLYTRLVVAPSQEVEHFKVVPDSWTRHVRGFSANVKGGRKVLPLTIEGKFTFTKAAAEYKMRKLRKQSNKKMLQGGRMK